MSNDMHNSFYCVYNKHVKCPSNGMRCVKSLIITKIKKKEDGLSYSYIDNNIFFAPKRPYEDVKCPFSTMEPYRGCGADHTN